MAYLADAASDETLNYIRDNATHLYILSGPPASWLNWAQVLANVIGYKESPTIGAPQDGAASGRRVVVAAIADGVVDPGGGSPAGEMWAIVNAADSEVLAANSVTNDQLLIDGNAFTLTAFSITIPDPA